MTIIINIPSGNRLRPGMGGCWGRGRGNHRDTPTPGGRGRQCVCVCVPCRFSLCLCVFERRKTAVAGEKKNTRTYVLITRGSTHLFK